MDVFQVKIIEQVVAVRTTVMDVWANNIDEAGAHALRGTQSVGAGNFGIVEDGVGIPERTKENIQFVKVE